jgi:hypothetical protein
LQYFYLDFTIVRTYRSGYIYWDWTCGIERKNELINQISNFPRISLEIQLIKFLKRDSLKKIERSAFKTDLTVDAKSINNRTHGYVSIRN